MEKKEYLTEENYEKGKKTLAKIIKIVLTVGLSISLLLIISGIIIIATSGNKENDKETTTTTTTTYSSKVRSEAEINADITARTTKINELKKGLPSLKAQKDNEFRNSRGFTEKYYELEQKISDLEDEISKLESEKRAFERELSNRESDLEYEKNKQEFEEEFNSIGNDIEPEGLFKKGIGGMLIAIGFGLIPPTLLISGMLFLIYKKREITIFTTQQTMPIAQEGIEKLAPTIGDAAGSIAEGITKGIKKGKEDSDK